VPDANEKGPLTIGQRTRIGEASPKAAGLVKPPLPVQRQSAGKSHRRRLKSSRPGKATVAGSKAVGLVKLPSPAKGSRPGKATVASRVKPELLSQLCRITWQSSVRSYQTLC